MLNIEEKEVKKNMCKEDLLAIAMEALEFYSDEHNWVRPHNDFSNAPGPSTIMLDGGHIASEALRILKDENKTSNSS